MRHKLAVILSLAIFAAGFMHINAQRPGEARAKARYFFLQGAQKQAQGLMPEAYELYKKAYLTDPSYSDAADAYGRNRLMVKTDSMQSLPMLRSSLALMQKYVDQYPADIIEARTYATLAQRLDTINEAIRIYERIDSLKPADKVNLLLLSDAYLNARRHGDALRALQRFENSEGMSPQLSMKKMNIMLIQGDTVAAVNEADNLIASNPREPSFYLLKGSLYEVLGKNDSTLQAYLQAERLAPESGPTKLALASTYKNMGDSVAFDNKLYEALLSDDFQLEDKLQLLTEYLQTLLDDASDTSRGDHLFSVIQNQFPHEPKVLDLAARYSGAKGDFKDAEEQMQYAIDLDPSKIEYWGQLMRFQVADDRPSDAMATYAKALQHVEKTDGLMLLFASAASMAKDYDTAEKAYADMLHNIDPALPLTDKIEESTSRMALSYEGLQHVSNIYNMLGDMYYAAEKPDSAWRAYDNSLFFFPSNVVTLNNYAYFLTETDGDLDKALEMSKEAIELEPDNDTYLDTYAWVLFKRKEYKDALDYQEKALEKAREKGEPESAEFFSHLGDILFMNHRPYEALANWKRALELDPDNALLKKKVEHKTFFFE